MHVLFHQRVLRHVVGAQFQHAHLLVHLPGLRHPGFPAGQRNAQAHRTVRRDCQRSDLESACRRTQWIQRPGDHVRCGCPTSDHGHVLGQPDQCTGFQHADAFRRSGTGQRRICLQRARCQRRAEPQHRTGTRRLLQRFGGINPDCTGQQRHSSQRTADLELERIAGRTQVQG